MNTLLTSSWGMLGPYSLSGERRTQTLGLTPAIRKFNDLAVPGMGGVWFGKQLLLAILGVAVADQVRAQGKRISKIEAANAIEAAACWLTFQNNGWQSDQRLRGFNKLRGQASFTFARARKPSFYVTQPMRQRTVQPLLSLGLVQTSSARFNSFLSAPAGAEFIEVATSDFRPSNKPLRDFLCHWVQSDEPLKENSVKLREALSPATAMPQGALSWLRNRLAIDDATELDARRRAAAEWMDDLHERIKGGARPRISWEVKPRQLTQAHWDDLKLGARFISVRDAAIDVLNQLERRLVFRSDAGLTLAPELLEGKPKDPLKDQVADLRQHAGQFLNMKSDPSPGAIASSFCKVLREKTDLEVLAELVRRDGRVLRLKGDRIVAKGPAFRSDLAGRESAREADGEATDEQITSRVHWPQSISPRCENLFLLTLDLRKGLSRLLKENR